MNFGGRNYQAPRYRGGSNETTEFWVEMAKLAFTVGLGVYSVNLMRKMIQAHADQINGSAEESAAAKRQLAEKLNRPELEKLELTAHEQRIAMDVLCADELGVAFSDIGGMENELEEVIDNVVLPMKMWRDYGSNMADMITCPAGVLLYGRPGTGKTMTAKAVAYECRATFINLKAGAVVDKWMGESEKLVAATFSLARKLAPSVIFIDEIDTILRKRSGLDSSQGSLATMQGTLLSEWDGIKSDNADSNLAPVVVLGATNRPMDLDAAILRRMPVQIRTKMPDAAGREDVLRKQLHSENVGSDVNMKLIARRTEDFSGSDLKELMRVALLTRTKRAIKVAEGERRQAEADYKNDEETRNNSNLESNSSGATMMRSVVPVKVSITAADFEVALSKTKPSGSATTDYTSELLLEEQRNRAEIVQNVLDKMNGGPGGGSEMDPSLD